MLKILKSAFHCTNIIKPTFAASQISLQSCSIINKRNIMVSYRHVQTQHGSYESNDEENIIVLRESHSPIPHSNVSVSDIKQSLESTTNESLESSSEKEISNNSVSQSSKTIENNLENKIDCIWFYECESSPKQDNILIETDTETCKSFFSAEKRKINQDEITKLTKRPKLDSNALKEKRPGFSEDRYNETSYYFENDLRKVYPYFFTFTTFTKGRWVGEKIIDVFAREFRAHPTEEYERSINAGSLIVNYKKVPIDYILKHNDLLANIVHRHEVPVTSQPIRIVEMNDDMVVVNKPASIPVHPCGRYRHNTVVFILAKEFNLKNLKTIHRLDRLTSGLLLFVRNIKKAREMEIQIRNREVKKQYVCRVEGEFPDDVIECNEPIEVVSYKIGVCKVSTKGKDCKTTFKKLNFDGKSSIVLCKPLTGRMHQIRVHLQYLGFPIINDPLYNHEVFGPQKGKFGDFGGKTDEQLVQDLILIHNVENWLNGDNDSDLFKPSGNKLSNMIISKDKKLENNIDSESVNKTHQMKETMNEFDKIANTNKIIVENKFHVATQTNHDAPDMKFDPTKMTEDEHCYECKMHFSDPRPKDLIMYLHAWKYEGPGWKYETDLPNWAKF